jgi:hypothetical protein
MSGDRSVFTVCFSIHISGVFQLLELEPGLRVIGLLLCALLVLSSTGRCDSDSPPSQPCPGAAAWQAAHPEESPEAMALRDGQRMYTDPDLRKQLKERFDEDQRARREYIKSPHDPDIARRVETIDSQNLIWLRNLVRDKGIPTVQQVGELGVHWAWLLVQHADRDRNFQASAQVVFAKRFEAGELPADDLAKLTDRILVAQGKPQRFGTQFDWLSRKFDTRNSGDLSEIDANRRKIGLMPLEDYACTMNAKLN